MNTGTLNKRVTFQVATETKNAYHEVTKAWADHKTVWARVAPLKGAEMFEAQKVNSQNSIKVTIRPDRTLTSQMRLVYNSQNYEITYIPPFDPVRGMVILASRND